MLRTTYSIHLFFFLIKKREYNILANNLKKKDTNTDAWVVQKVCSLGDGSER